jgi:hypothetical protein
MKSWMSSAAWDPVSCGLYTNGEFLSYMDRANNPSMPGWCMLPIFGEVGLNNDGRLGAKRDRKVFVMLHLSSDPFFPYSMQPVFPLQRTGEAARAEKRAQRKASIQQSATSKHDPQIGSRVARPVQRDSLLSQASHSSARSSTSFASMLLAAPTPPLSLLQPLAAINVNSVIVSLPFNTGSKVAPIGV